RAPARAAPPGKLDAIVGGALVLAVVDHRRRQPRRVRVRQVDPRIIPGDAGAMPTHRNLAHAGPASTLSSSNGADQDHRGMLAVLSGGIGSDLADPSAEAFPSLVEPHGHRPGSSRPWA